MRAGELKMSPTHSTSFNLLCMRVGDDKRATTITQKFHLQHCSSKQLYGKFLKLHKIIGSFERMSCRRSQVNLLFAMRVVFSGKRKECNLRVTTFMY